MVWCYPGTDPQFIGWLGMHGQLHGTSSMHHSDVDSVRLGARFDDRVINGEASSARTQGPIHVDIDLRPSLNHPCRRAICWAG